MDKAIIHIDDGWVITDGGQAVTLTGTVYLNGPATFEDIGDAKIWLDKDNSGVWNWPEPQFSLMSGTVVEYSLPAGTEPYRLKFFSNNSWVMIGMEPPNPTSNLTGNDFYIEFNS